MTSSDVSLAIIAVILFSTLIPRTVNYFVPEAIKMDDTWIRTYTGLSQSVLFGLAGLLDVFQGAIDWFTWACLFFTAVGTFTLTGGILQLKEKAQDLKYGYELAEEYAKVLTPHQRNTAHDSFRKRFSR